MRGVVVGDKAPKTITVEVVRQFRHPKYGKLVRRKRRVHAHDEKDEACLGDTVEIVECRPMSATKCWRLMRIVERGAPLVAIAEPGAPPAGTPAP
jgi:small subunit ribosomal protein S17